MYMKLRNIISAIIIASSACLVSCDKMMDKAMQAVMESASNHDYQDSEKWGKVTTVDLPVLTFNEAEIEGAVRLEYTQDNIFSLKVYGNEKAINAYSVKFDDNELEVILKEGVDHVNRNTPAITVRITAPTLTDIKGSGVSEVVFMNSVVQEEGMDISLGGVGKLSIGSLRVPELDLSISGAGEANLADVTTTGKMELRVEGAAKLKGKAVAQKLELKLMGAASGTLDIHSRKTSVVASGASYLTLTGETESLEMNSAESSSVKKDGLKVGH